MENTQIIILAGGKGVRMKSDDPKALTMLGEKSFLKRILDTVSSLHLPTPPIIVVSYKKEKVMETLGEGYVYAEQEAPLGTGHAVKSAKGRVAPGHQTVLVLSSDQPLLSKETIENILKTHEEKKPTVTMATMTLPDFEEWRVGLRHFGRIVRNEKGEIEGIVEFKDAMEREKLIRELNPAVYAFDAEWLWKNIDNIRNENAQKEYYLTDLIKMAHEQGKRIEGVPLADIIEGLQPNSKEEVAVLVKVAKI